MLTKPFFLCVVLGLIGCSYLTQHNMLPRGRPALSPDVQPQVSDLYVPNCPRQALAILLGYCVDFAEHLNDAGHIFQPFTCAGGDVTVVARAVEDAADNAILSLDNLVKVAAYVFDPKPHNIDLRTATDITDRAAKVALTLTSGFNSLRDTLRFATTWIPEVATKLATAYAICAFCSAYNAYYVYTMLNTRPTTSDRLYTAANKAFTAAAIAVIATHLLAVFIDEERADAANALTNARAVHALTRFAVWAGVKLTPAVVDAVIFIAYAAAHRTIDAASVTTILPDTPGDTSMNNVLNTIVTAFPNTDTATELYNALAAVSTCDLSLPLVQLAFAIHFARISPSTIRS